MLSVAVIDIPAAAMVALDPVRSRLLHELSEPASAAALSARLGIARQKINYHLRALEAHQLVRVAGELRGGGLTERVLVATAYVFSPGAVGPAATDPDRNRDRLSAGYLISLAARVIREARDLLGRSEETGKCLPTLSIDTVICYRSPAERAAFSNELSAAVARLAARYLCFRKSQPKESPMSNNRVVHFEIPADQPEALTQFYTGLFGWKFQKAPLPGPEYWLCDTGSDGPGINGAVMQRQNPRQPWMNYVDVPSIDAALEKATQLGANIALPKTPIPGVGALAAIIDPQGNICGLWEQTPPK